MAALLTSLGISIRAPREGGNLVPDYSLCALSVISIHAPREGGDFHQFFPVYYRFHFNPRPPRGGRLALIARSGSPLFISIHAPREGGD